MRMPIVILGELGPLLTQDNRGRLVAELSANPNTSAAIIRDRLPLYGVSEAVTEEIVSEFESLRNEKGKKS